MKADLIEVMGSDLTVVNAARVSMAKQSEWEIEIQYEYSDYGKECEEYHKHFLSEKDTKLIKYLSTHGHWTPFSHPQIMMREKVPIFVARQRFKHMVGFTYNEVSRRYVDDEPEFFVPDTFRSKAENVKQGSGDSLPYKQEEYISGLKEFHEMAGNYYRWLLDEGVAPEQARMVLPQSMYTEYYVTGSLAAWARAYKQRIDPHAQKEIQELAKQWDDIIRPLFPVSWKELTE
jgi:thymidylate synthase (FAD)